MANRDFDQHYYRKAMRYCRNVREAKRETQAAVASRVGVGHAHYCKMENGARLPTDGVLHKILQVLEITDEELEMHVAGRQIEVVEPAVVAAPSQQRRDRQPVALITCAVVMAGICAYGFLMRNRSSGAAHADLGTLVKRAGLFEVCTVYRDAARFREEELDRYWLAGSPEWNRIVRGARRLAGSGLHYGDGVRATVFRVGETSVSAAGDRATVRTTEAWYLPICDSAGHVIRTPPFPVTPISYALRNVSGRWLIEQSTTPVPPEPIRIHAHAVMTVGTAAVRSGSRPRENWLTRIPDAAARERIRRRWEQLRRDPEPFAAPALGSYRVGNAVMQGFGRWANHGTSAIIDWPGEPGNSSLYVRGAIWDFYVYVGGPTSWLGMPSGNEEDAGVSPSGAHGVRQRFQHGYVYWTDGGGIGAHSVSVRMAEELARRGGVIIVGYPVSEPRTGGHYQQFEVAGIELGRPSTAANGD